MSFWKDFLNNFMDISYQVVPIVLLAIGLSLLANRLTRKSDDE